MNDESKSTVLQQFSFLRGADGRLLDEIDSGGTLVRLPSHQAVFREGDACDKVVLLGRGKVRVFKVGETGREVTLYRVRPGEACILNVACVVGGRLYPADALTEEPVAAVTVAPKLFLEWMDRIPQVRRFMFQLMGTRFVSLMLRVEEITFSRMDRRLAAFLLEHSSANGPTLELTHEAIAAELGSAREVMSRLLKSFERRGFVRLGRARLEVLDAQALVRVAEARDTATHRAGVDF